MLTLAVSKGAMPYAKGRTAAMIDIDAQQDEYITAQGGAGLFTAVAGKGPLSVFEYLAKRSENLGKSKVMTDIQSAMDNYVKTLELALSKQVQATATPATFEGVAAKFKSTVESSATNAYKEFDKYVRPAEGKTGFPCGKKEDGTRPECPSEKDDKQEVTKAMCCAAMVP